MAPAKKKTAPKKAPEMEELHFKKDQLGLVQEILSELDSNHKLSWDDSESVATGTTNTGGIIVFVGPSEDTDDAIFKFTMNEEGKKLYLTIKKREEEKINELTAKGTVFEKTRLTDIKTGDGMRLGDNLSLLREYDTFFKSVGIQSVLFRKTPSGSKIESYVPEVPTIIFAPQATHETLRRFNESQYADAFRTLTGYQCGLVGDCDPKPVHGEPTTTLFFDNDSKNPIGTYYPQRNLVLWYANLFYRAEQSKLPNAWGNAFLAQMRTVLLRELSKCKIKTNDTSGFAMKLMVQEFSEAGLKKVREIENKQTDLQRKIESYEQNLLQVMTEYIANKDVLSALTVVGDKSIEIFTKEIELLKKNPLVTKVSLSDGKVNITFKPTTIKAPVVREVADDKDGDLYEMYIGAITAHLSGDGSISVSCDYPAGSNAHPHVSGNSPCLGQGDGPTLMRRLIAEKKLSEFPYSFWMWIRRWRPNDCYIKPYQYIDDRLKKGLPVFNSKGERVTLNDPTLIKKGILMQITKDSCYEENMAKFKDFKPQA